MKWVRRTVVAVVLLGVASVGQAEPFRVVASFSVLGDLVDQIGGDRVTLDVLVGPNGDTHRYEPTPQDAVAIGRADLVVMNGLAFEGWMPRLMETADFTGQRLVLGERIEPLRLEHQYAHAGEDESADEHAHDDKRGSHHDGDHGATDEADHNDYRHNDHHHDGEFDPHAWHSLPHAMSYVAVITEKLAAMDPGNAEYYRTRSDKYLNRLRGLQNWAVDAFAEVPESRRRIITPHDAFGYLAHEYGLHIEAPQGFSTESEASARRLGDLILQVRMNNISAVFLENVAGDQLIRQIERETKVRFGGTLYSDALSEASGPAGTYEAMMRHNLESLVKALRRLG